MATFNVSNSNDSGAGSLRQSILSANALTGKDTINFNGVFTDNIADTITLSGSSFQITDDLSIKGTGASLLTINGNNASSVFEISNNVTVEIAGLTVTNGYSSDASGSITNNGTLTLLNSAIKNNFGYLGSGIYNSGTLTLKDSTISDNLGYLGSGIYNSGSLTIKDSTISKNYTLSNGSAGGIYNSGFLTVKDSTISDNLGGKEAGGIYNSGGTATVTNSTISGNKSSDSGAGIYNSGIFSISDSTISSNQITIDNDGGGIYNSGSLTIDNSTISSNSAEAGGGIYNQGKLALSNSTITLNTAYNYYQNGGAGGIQNSGSGTATVKNSIIAGNFDTPQKDSTNTTKPDVVGLFSSNNFNLIGNLNGSKGFNAKEQLNVGIERVLNTNLRYNGGATKTHALVTGSRAINGGKNADIPADTTDFDGDGNTTEQVLFDGRGSSFKRISGGRVDIGAFEAVVNVINGTRSRDKIKGTAANDIITGFQGEDTLTGGAGADEFVYTRYRDAGDTITDLKVGTDKIVLRQLFSSLGLGNLSYANAVDGGYLSFGSQGSDSIVFIDSDGSSGVGRRLKLVKVNKVSSRALKNAINFAL
ncbi:choice-of-anchor Q domain-containing protein [Nostoc sp. MG11]|uniref:choice-of-anchor Q domain-containing protein n=1 Tax=Nostoc sp. MG11 TaxID=2721166 RepID=UPI0018686EAE|nr:choice-of-anchor Q domain-containing protein [Nostoc sp. MG11]